MKAGWAVKKLGEIADIQSGSGFPEKFQGIKNQDIPFYKVSDMNLVGNEREMTFENNTVTEQIRVQLGATIFPKGSTIFPKIGGAILTNKKRVATKDCCVDNNVMGAIPKQNIVDSKFLHYFFQSHDLLEFANDAHLPSIRKTVVENWPINIPLSITEQQRIVAILDKAFEGIAKARANAEQNLQNARALFESHLHSIDAEKKELGEFVSIKTGKLDANAAVEDGLYPFFTCSRDVYRIDNFAFDCEAILLAGNNASGDFNVKHYIGKFNAYQRTYVITVKNENEASYRYLYFQLLAKLKEFKKQSVGSNTKFLKIGMIQGMKIPIPTFTEQEAIVFKLDGLLTETQRLETLYQRKIACLDELKKSLLQQAFAGEL
jgi:type I restriction enzyme S subunit